MLEVENIAGYDPVNFLKKHLNLILPQDSHLESIYFPGYVKKAFHSVDRPSGLVIVDYSSPKQAKEKLYLYIKHHRNACGIYNNMSQIYMELEKLGQADHMPRPYLCDKDHDAIYMEYTKGIDIKYITFLYLALNRRIKLRKIFFEIGNWLNSFHQAVPTGEVVEFSEIESNIYKALDGTAFFNETEKQQIRHKIEEKSKTVPTAFSLVRPHNDFALRNIIYLKPDDFVVIDWDAMYHKKFPSEAPIWNDITTLVLNVISLGRFSPIITNSDVQKLADSFMNGYFERDSGSTDRKSLMDQLYIFTLCYYLGIIGDRPLPEIYKGKLGFIYLDRLKKNLLRGTVY
jgi:hypothetical protein